MSPRKPGIYLPTYANLLHYDVQGTALDSEIESGDVVCIDYEHKERYCWVVAPRYKDKMHVLDIEHISSDNLIRVVETMDPDELLQSMYRKVPEEVVTAAYRTFNYNKLDILRKYFFGVNDEMKEEIYTYLEGYHSVLIGLFPNIHIPLHHIELKKTIIPMIKENQKVYYIEDILGRGIRDNIIKEYFDKLIGTPYSVDEIEIVDIPITEEEVKNDLINSGYYVGFEDQIPLEAINVRQNSMTHEKKIKQLLDFITSNQGQVIFMSPITIREILPSLRQNL